MKAEGGWAVVNTGMTSISPEYDHSGREVVSRIWDDADVRNWGLLCDRIHEHGALAGIELMASGGHVTGYETRLPAGAVSSVADDWLFMGSSFEMDHDDIRRVQRQYVAAARRARHAGFDIVNVMGAELVALPMIFLMSRYNRRSDEYGGSFENRARFWLETIEQVRAEVGDHCAVTARLCIDTLDGSDQGVRAGHEAAGFIRMADHLVDFWDVMVGGEGNTWGKDLGPSRFYSENFQGEYVRQVRPHTAKPLVAVGRFTSPDTMAQVIRSGQQDIIGSARASISDPFLPQKTSEGRVDEIRECIGCNVCVSRINTATRIICTQNATTGEEYRRGWHPERFAPRQRRPLAGVGRRRRAGRARVRHRAGQAAGRVRPRGRRGAATGRTYGMGPAPPRPGRVGAHRPPSSDPGRQAVQPHARSQQAAQRGRHPRLRRRGRHSHGRIRVGARRPLLGHPRARSPAPMPTAPTC